MVRQSRINLDKLGTYASSICAVHCLLTGIAFGLLSVAGLGFFGSVWTDVAFLSVAVVVGAFAVWHGIKAHHSYVPASVFSLGLAFIVLGHFVFRHPHEISAAENPTSHYLSTAFSVLGGVCLVGFHLLNMRLHKTAGCDCKACEKGVTVQAGSTQKSG